MSKKFSHIWTEEERYAKFLKEKRKITSIFKQMAPDKKKIAEGLIETSSRMRVMIMELDLIIERDGYIEEYMNGANQYGMKKSAAIEVYDKTVNTYSKVIKQLCELMPTDPATAGPGAAIMEFLTK